MEALNMGWLDETRREYLKVTEVAELFSLSRRTVYNLLDEGVLEGIKINGTTLRISIASVRRMKEQAPNI